MAAAVVCTVGGSHWNDIDGGEWMGCWAPAFCPHRHTSTSFSIHNGMEMDPLTLTGMLSCYKQIFNGHFIISKMELIFCVNWFQHLHLVISPIGSIWIIDVHCLKAVSPPGDAGLIAFKFGIYNQSIITLITTWNWQLILDKTEAKFLTCLLVWVMGQLYG